MSGASLPFGSVKAVADSDSSEDPGGYVSDGSPIRGISVLHDDGMSITVTMYFAALNSTPIGTGGNSSLGQFKVLPMFCSSLSACNTTESSRVVAQVPGSVAGSPGFFGLSLASGIKVRV